jgi:hypothetical protein
MQEHARDCPRVPADARDSPLIPGTVRNGKGRYGNGKERNGTVGARERDDDEPESEFQKLVGLPVALGGTVQ